MRYTGMATGGGGYNRYGVGAKVYGSGRSNPTMGPVDKMGYRERDAKAKARRAAMLKKIRANFSKNYGSPAYLRDLGQ
jgi:hypothetical protein